MWSLSYCKKVVIGLERIGPIGVNGRWPLKIAIQIDDTVIHADDIEVDDPFHAKDYLDVSKYLDRTLDDEINNKKSKDNLLMSRKIDEYRKGLFVSLKLKDFLGSFIGCKIEVQIREVRAANESRSIHSVHWEHLEDIMLWSAQRQGWTSGYRGPLSVTVRRYIEGADVASPSAGPRRRTSQISQNGKIERFNILLVVARKHLYDQLNIDYLNPTIIQRALLEAQEELEARGSYQLINIEVVRPGSLKELEDHLKEHEEMGQSQNFRIVHFDMHGGVSSDGAYLEFNEFNEATEKLTTTQVKAATIAKVLLKNNIDCTVLSACNSAKADSGIHANLSLSFLESGLSCVLGLSYNMPDSLSKIFYGKFYHEIFIEREEFAEAATKARYELRRNPQRWSYTNKKDLEIQDWFIPVVYSSGIDWYVDPHQTSRQTVLSRTLRMLQSLFSWVLWVILSLVAAVVILYTIPTLKVLVSSIIKPFAQDMDAFSQGTVQQVRNTCLGSLFYSLHKSVRPFQSWKRWNFRRGLENIDQDRKNILRIEGDLKRSRKIFVHTLDDVEQTAPQLMRTLTDVWRRTRLVEHIVFIQAEWFIQRFQPDSTGEHGFIDWAASLRSLSHAMMLWMGSLSPGLKTRSPSDKTQKIRTVVVINNVNMLYPEATLLRNHHLQAQQRFERWVEKLDTTTCYLVLLGQGLKHNTRGWFNTTLGKCTALQSTAMTEYTNPREFKYNREKPSPSRSWL